MNSKIIQILTDYNSMVKNIKWNVTCMIGQSLVIQNPKVINLQNVPAFINIGSLEFDANQCLGLTLLKRERDVRCNELISLGKRGLLCDVLELTADLLMRVARISNGGQDPFDSNQHFNTDIRELWNKKKGKAGHLLVCSSHGDFFKNLAAPIRHWVRHGNGNIPYGKYIYYKEEILGFNIDIDQKWIEGTDNKLDINFDKSYEIFQVIEKISQEAIQKLEKSP